MDCTLDYSIVVPAYNEEHFLGATLAALRLAMEHAEVWRGEVIVVDNASTDRTAEVARAHGARVEYEAHRQIARARNAGAAVAQGRWLVFVDADTTIPRALLRASLAALAGQGCCGGGAPIDPTGPYRSLRLAIHTWNRCSRWLGWACGAYVFCRSDAFAAVGGFDERVYATEEIGLSRALKQWGRERGMRMRILDVAIVTSTRKLDWYGPLGTARLLLGLLLQPRGVADPEACRLWYRRPESAALSSSPAARDSAPPLAPPR